jgi:choline dehydrogenase
MSEHFDVVIVGAGSTGATVAARLAERSSRRVLLLEAGADHPHEAERPPPWLMLGAFTGASGAAVPEHDWNYAAEPALPGGDPIAVPRGKLVGGTSMINGCVAVRGRPADFDAWVAAGATGWSWAEVLPHYEAAERELSLMTYPAELWLPIQRAFVDGSREIGFRHVDDMNAADAWDGVVGPWPRNRRNEIRQGSLVTYVRRARTLPNFELRAGMLVDRVLLSGTRAIGVSAIDGRGRAVELAADHVILSAGAYGSPPILMRSGIGPPRRLRELGVPTIADLPVGQGLMEHPGIQFAVSVTAAAARMGWPHLAVVGRGEGYWSIPAPLDQEAGIAAVSYFLGLTDGPPGHIALRSPRPGAPPIIDHGYGAVIGSAAFDRAWADFQALLATRAYRDIGARDLHDGMPLAERVNGGIRTGTHPAGGCGIGKVVDPELRVHGFDGLSVADASVFPRHVTNNPNLTCHMIGEHLAARLAATGPGADRAGG